MIAILNKQLFNPKRPMKRKFLLSIALALIYSTAGAQSLRKPDVEEEMLREGYAKIQNAVTNIGREKSLEMRLAYNVPFERMDKLFTFIKNREMRKYCYNTIYADSILKRVMCKMEIDSLYRDSINTVLIPLSGNKISGENISYALRSSEALQLDKAQYDYMMDKAVDMARRVHKDRTLNVWNEEMDVLRKSLTSKQLTYFFVIKNLDKVSADIDNGWKKLVNAGLAVQLDSAKEFPLAFKYYQEWYKIKDMYRYYGTSQKKYIAELEKHKPAMVQMIATLDKNEREQKKNKQKTKTIGKEFVW